MTQSNVTPIDNKQQQPSCRFTISALVDGFPVQIEGETSNASNLRALVDKLKSIGAVPPVLSNNSPTNADDAPVCEFHGKMRRGNHGWFCPKKMGDGSYCKSKA